VLPDGLVFDDFSSCEYLALLQQVLYTTDELDESVTYESFVVVPESLRASLIEKFGNEVEINGPFVSCCTANIAFIYLFYPCLTNLFGFQSCWTTWDICLFENSSPFSVMYFLLLAGDECNDHKYSQRLEEL
jgi:hypothetical protein